MSAEERADWLRTQERMAHETLSSSGTSNPTNLSRNSDTDSIASDPDLLQLRRDAAKADRELQEAEAALEAQRAALAQADAQPGQADSNLLSTSTVSTRLDITGQQPINIAGSQQAATMPDPIEGYWAITSNSGGCDYVFGVSGVGYGGRIVRLGGNTFSLNRSIITKSAPGVYIGRENGDGKPITTRDEVYRVNGLAMQVTETLHYVAADYGIVGKSVVQVGNHNAVCSCVITLRKQ
jgi:hypothetical protein